MLEAPKKLKEDVVIFEPFEDYIETAMTRKIAKKIGIRSKC
ncbi:hypothetical protein [Pyrococcus kukulkanii]